MMRILVVEDDLLLSRSLIATLRDEGYAVDQAQNGEEGLYKALEDVYDAIILDVMMPVLDGWQVIEKLRLEVNTPVLMLTARDTISDKVRGFKNGADDYLTKPFEPEELIARLQAIIRRSSGMAHPCIKIGDISVDISTKQVTRRNMSVQLTAREYSLLEYLAVNKGNVVSRTILYDRLFDENDDTMSNLLDVHVSNLRKKLGAGVITTRRGHGYIIEN